MNKKNYKLLTIISVLLMLTFVHWYTRPRITSDEVNGMIAEEVPISSSRARVEDFLRRHQIKYTEYYSISVEDQLKLNEGSSINREPIKGRIDAAIPNARRGLLSSNGIYIIFFFDSHDRLVSYKINELGTGL